MTTTFVDNNPSIPNPVLASKNTILIFGTASKGDLRTPTVVSPENVRELFGDFPSYSADNNQYWRSAVRAYYELLSGLNSTVPLDTYPIALVRIGNASRASTLLYEKAQTK